jgi:hypothetical protein
LPVHLVASIGVLAFNPDPNGEIGIVRSARQPIAFLGAAAHLRVGSQELNDRCNRIAIGRKALSNAAAVKREPRSPNELPPDKVGHQELSGLEMPKCTRLLAFAQRPMRLTATAASDTAAIQPIRALSQSHWIRQMLDEREGAGREPRLSKGFQPSFSLVS